MSHVTDIILICSGIDSDWNKAETIDVLNLRLKRMKPTGGELKLCSDNLLTDRVLQAEVWMGAYNYLDISVFYKCFKRIRWEKPEAVMLLIKDEHEEEFTPYSAGNRVFKEDWL